MPKPKLFYPTRNVVGVEPIWRERQLAILGVTDLKQNPITTSEFLRRPLVRRGRFRVLAWDREARQYRQFYQDCFQHLFRETSLLVGYRDGDSIIPLSRPYESTVDERREMAMLVHQLKNDPDVVIYTVGLRVVQ